MSHTLNPNLVVQEEAEEGQRGGREAPTLAHREHRHASGQYPKPQPQPQGC